MSNAIPSTPMFQKPQRTQAKFQSTLVFKEFERACSMAMTISWWQELVNTRPSAKAAKAATSSDTSPSATRGVSSSAISALQGAGKKRTDYLCVR